MVVKADLDVQHHGCLMTSVHGDTVILQVSADEECDLILVRGDPREVERVVRHIEDDHIEPFDVMSRTDNSALLRTRNPPVGVIPTILAHGCTILWPAVYRDGWEHYSILAPSAARLRGLVGQLKPFGPVKVASSAEVPAEAVAATVPLADLTAGLTRRQLDALLLAVREGYYDVPRRSEARDLATTLGIGRSTYEEHLRKGERQVMQRFAGLVQTHDALTTAAAKRPGRPPSKRRQFA